MPRKFLGKQISLFQRKVIETVKKIPPGKVLTYKEVASLSGFPRAWRAVGNLLRKNKDPKIPCHRVVRSDFKVGNYNRGKGRKVALLRKEGVIIKDGKVIR